MKAFKSSIGMLMCLILIFTGLLVGCSNSNQNGGGNQSQSNKPEDSGSSNKNEEVKPVDFKIVTWAQPGSKEAMDKVLAEYKKVKPNVTIHYEEVAQNNTDFDTWMSAQLTGNQEPEVAIDFTGDVPYSKYVDKGYKVLDMKPYLEKNSPYTNKPWGESFREVDLNTMRSSQDGNLYNIATTMVTLKIAYNKEVYKQLGLNIPRTYSEMIENFKKIKEAGNIEPFAGFLKITAGWDWFARFSGQQIQEHLVPKIDTLNPDKLYETAEYIQAVDEGIIDLHKPEIRKVYEMFHDFSSYFAPGAIAMSLPEAVDMWLQEKAAHTFTIIFDAKPFATDKKPPFDWGTFEFPVITKDIAPTSNENPAEFGDLGNALVVMPSASKRGIQDEVMDFIMFYTSPETAAFIADERWLIPTTVGVEPNADIKPYLPKYRPQKMIELNTQFRLSAEARQFTHQQIQRLALNDITVEQLIDAVSEKMKEEAKKVKEERGWTKENNYGSK